MGWGWVVVRGKVPWVVGGSRRERLPAWAANTGHLLFSWRVVFNVSTIHLEKSQAMKRNTQVNLKFIHTQYYKLYNYGYFLYLKEPQALVWLTWSTSMALAYTLSLPCIIADSLAAAARVGDKAWLSLMDWFFSTERDEPQRGDISLLHLVSTVTPKNSSQTQEVTWTSCAVARHCPEPRVSAWACVCLSGSLRTHVSACASVSGHL